MLATVDGAAVCSAAAGKQPGSQAWPALPASPPSLLTSGTPLEPAPSLEEALGSLTVHDKGAGCLAPGHGTGGGSGGAGSPTGGGTPPASEAWVLTAGLASSAATSGLSPDIRQVPMPAVSQHKRGNMFGPLESRVELAPALRAALLQQAQVQQGRREQRRAPATAALMQAQQARVHLHGMAVPTGRAATPAASASLISGGLMTPSHSLDDLTAPGSLLTGAMSRAPSAALAPELQAFLLQQQQPDEAAASWATAHNNSCGSLDLLSQASLQAAEPLATLRPSPTPQLTGAGGGAGAGFDWPLEGTQLPCLPGSLAAAAAPQLGVLPLSGGSSGPTSMSAYQAGPWTPACFPAPQAALPAGPAFPQSLPQVLGAQLPAHLQSLLLHEQQHSAALLQPFPSSHGLPRPRLYHPHPQQAVQGLARRLAQAATQDPPELLVGPQGRYQPYCQQVISARLNHAATSALSIIRLLQSRDTPAIAAQIGKRYYCSLKEVAKVVGGARCLLVAPDVQISSTANINPVRALQRILLDAQAAGVPVIFALSRRGIGQVFGRDKSMSIVAIMRLEGLEGEYGVMVEEAIQGRQLYMQHRGGAPTAAALAPMGGHLPGVPVAGDIGAAAIAAIQRAQAALSLPAAQLGIRP
ncbi:hypothetical protein CHLNCDRAFT_51502 [Chlorella variabilis]|uniref:Ribosomal protein L7Ae/L30e/S12e/Gadd45 domain-containing protein n=1 Tax=Chlorella variabilis TaxID=554065 RepID=E1ZC10_CHLVA|nr:hypothetical protein CHLNCDRAFT_51502 [Chlorella variabilis]EFN56731.1 hypothetical protein CHLNCDRAFT_51502 [Chlorella variabilis]|eukprot:XP_005848833.1 hypothetical protein CHLNCDRAFT_51502 [Chlorella variabilis]